MTNIIVRINFMCYHLFSLFLNLNPAARDCIHFKYCTPLHTIIQALNPTKIHRQLLPPAAKNLFEKRFLDIQKLFIKTLTPQPEFNTISSHERAQIKTLPEIYHH